MLKQNVFLLTFDFSGYFVSLELFNSGSCGLSDGEYISLGYFEQYDIDDVLEYVIGKYDFIDEKKYCPQHHL